MNTPKEDGAYKIGFLLLPGFTLLSFASAVEVLRMANYVANKTLYTWTLCSLDASAASSSGLMLEQSSTDALFDCDLVMVCSGYQLHTGETEQIKKLLVKLDKQQISLGGLCTGAYTLAWAGVMDGYEAAIHWENLLAAQERFPNVMFRDSIYIIDKNRCTATGGIGALDLFVHIVHKHFGRELAHMVSQMFVMDRIRGAETTQSMPLPKGSEPGYEHVVEADSLMRANLEEPLSLQEVAQLIKISLRQLERLFLRYTALSPGQYYLNLRLRRARELLNQTSMPIMDITLACGFATHSYFCKAYRRCYGHSPRQERRGKMNQAA